MAISWTKPKTRIIYIKIPKIPSPKYQAPYDVSMTLVSQSFGID